MYQQIVTHGSACIGDPARIVAVPRIHQYADGLHQGGGEHHGLAIGFVLEAVARVDVGDTARLPGGAVHQDGVDGRVGPQLKIFSAPQLWDENVQAAVPGTYVAAPVACTARVTERYAIVVTALTSQ